MDINENDYFGLDFSNTALTNEEMANVSNIGFLVTSYLETKESTFEIIDYSKNNYDNS